MISRSDKPRVCSRCTSMRATNAPRLAPALPDTPPVARVQTLFIRKIVVKIETKAPLARVRELLLQVQKEMIMEDRFKSLIVYYDVDPM